MLVNDVKLEKCPFCGGKAKIHLYLSKYYANCKKCKTFSAPYDTAEQAAAAWNTRYYTAGVDLNNSKKGACKNCVHGNFRKFVLYCDKYNIPMLFEDNCDDFQPMQTY